MASAGSAPRRAPLWTVCSIVMGTVLIALSGGVYVAAQTLANRYESRIHRADLLGEEQRNDGREIGKVTGPMNILLIGSDTRDAETYDPKDPSSSTASVDGQRGDTVMILHIPRSMDAGYAISLPRDSYVYVPQNQEGTQGGHYTKLNAAYAWGGAPLMVKTVERLTGMTMHHVVVADFSSVRDITDLVGGVTVTVDETTTDPRSKRTFQKGKNRLDGEAAEDYVRQRYGLRNGDLDRMKRQQQYLRALIDTVTETNWIGNPTRFDKLLLKVTDSLTVDESMPVTELAFSLRNIDPDSVKFYTAPIARDGYSEAGAVLYLDTAASQELFTAVQNDTMHQYAATHPGNSTDSGV